MGFSVSWMGFQTDDPRRVLASAGLRETREPDEMNEEPFSGAMLPGPWYIVFSNDCTFVSPERLATLSRHFCVVACQVHEGSMFSSAFGYDDGESTWEVSHDSDSGLYDLTWSGKMPPGFEAIRQRLMQQQEKEGGTDAGVDYIFEIPVETAHAVCGYRHDEFDFDRGEPAFTRLDTLDG